MIISRTPYRISFLGGGTDYPDWYRQHGGAVLATTIDKYVYLTCRYLPPFFEHRYRIVYSKIEMCHSFDEIAHPAVREVLRYLNLDRGVEIHHDGDLPARSGMGTSSAFVVGLLHALYALKGEMKSKHQLAMETIHIEQNILQETVGSQDQICAAYGGLNQIQFLPNGEASVNPITIANDRLLELESHLMLFYTGIKRTASDVAKSYVTEFDQKKRQLRMLRQLVDEGVSLLTSTRPIAEFGELLNEAWHIKRSMGEKISNPGIDNIYERAMLAGALGGKITGAGGGGFMMLFVPPEDQPAVRSALDDLLHIPFKFEYSGSQIIFFDREQEYLAEEQARSGKIPVIFQEMVSDEA